jgi:acyl-CoA synthetase (AMP-forming)/AMP-acid ligase II
MTFKTDPPKKLFRSLRELVELRGSDLPGKVFIISPESGASLTFGAYRTAVLELDAKLKELGVQPGSKVAVILSNGLNAAVAILAVMSAGGVAVPINPRLTEQEIAGLLAHSKAQLVITDQRNNGNLPNAVRDAGERGLDGVESDNPYRLFRAAAQDTQGSPNAGCHPGWKDPALILYTSGTTGHPKGVVLTHGNLLSNSGYVVTAHHLTCTDTALCVLPLFHINGFVVTLLSPLLSGGAVVMPRRFSAEHFWHHVSDYRVTWFSAVPTILSKLLSHPNPAEIDTSGLRLARSASAPLPVAVLAEFEQRFAVPVIETYGISEAGCQVCANPLPPLPHKPGSAGQPVGNRLKVVDSRGTPLPKGLVGEVVISGENVFSGYLDNADADREALRDGWFHTGDLGFLDEDGYLFLTGRKKELINRAGEKITPREVEEVLHRLPEVETVGVVGVPHQVYGEEIVAFITLRHDQKLEAEEVRQFCREHLAGFKVPREVFFIEELPKRPSGKVQRRRLRDVYHHLTTQSKEEKPS